MSARQSKTLAFTLVELLVVIGIIGLLISLLLPALSRAREQANRIKCAANLRTLGQVCTLFANDHKGYFPAAWGYGQQQFSNVAVALPVILNYNPPNDDDVITWKRFGSSYQGLLRYAPTNVDQGADVAYFNPGATGTYVKLANWLICPSVAPAITANYQAWINAGSFGFAIQTSYQYVAGITPRQVGTVWGPYGGITNVSGFNWGQRSPAVRLSDKANTSVIATDTVRWIGGLSNNNYQINHQDPADVRKAAFQNILYGDGHVEGGVPSYTDRVTGLKSALLTINNYSLIRDLAVPTSGDFFYWGQ